MTIRARGPAARWLRLLLGALVGLAAGGRGWAHVCPVGPTMTFAFPADGATVSGEFNVQVTPTPPPSGFTVNGWDKAYLFVMQAGYYPGDDAHMLCKLMQSNPNETGPWWTDLNTTTLPNGDYWLFSYSRLIPDDYYTMPDSEPCDYGLTTYITIHVNNPDTTRMYPHSSMDCPCRCDGQQTGSTTSPLTGHQSWGVPITSWNSHGATYRFGLTYDSHALVVPQEVGTSAEEPNFNGLSERNSHWTQPYAQWIELARDEHGTLSALWHRGSVPTAFEWDAVKGQFVNPDSDYFLSFTPGPISMNVNCGSPPVMMAAQSDYATFTITDRAGTTYTFNMVEWQVPPNSMCTARPYYLLTQIRDRWTRTLNITWTDQPVGSGMEKRVTSAKDQDGIGLTLAYPNGDGLLRSVTDAQGRTHSLGYTGETDEEIPVPPQTEVTRQKLTSVTVYGPGAGPGNSNRVVYQWKFAYHVDPMVDPAELNDSLMYGGTVTGDLVIKKTEPDGLATYYRYEPVTLEKSDANATQYQRPTAADWEGRVTRISYYDTSEGGTVERAITRVPNSASQATLTYPGGVAIQYSYSGTDLTAVTELATMNTWSSTFDGKHNLTTVRTPLETTGSPLVQYDYSFDIYGHIRIVTARYRKDDGTLGSCDVGDATLTQLNSLGEPKFITEIARSGNPQDDHVLAFEYDNGGPLTLGKLTRITEAPGTALQQVRSLIYQSPDGDWGLPTAVTNEVGGQTMLDYDDSTGQLLKTTSPPNLVPNTGDPAASVTMLGYTADGLPSLIQDPMGHQIQISYAPDPANPANLVVTATFNDGSTQTATVDPKGRILQAVDEKHVVTAWTYNPAGQVKSVTRDAMDPDPSLHRTTLFSYDDQGNLRYFDPPLGMMGRVQFEYVRYTLDANNNPVLDGRYQGEVTHVTYPDGRQEYFGYNDAGELAWARKGSGAVIQISGRDGQHRVTRIDYPDEGASFGFAATTTFDEFGRPVASTDRQGTTQRFFDLLDRPTQVLPPSPQAALTFSYTPDTTLQRWITTVTAAGVGSYVYKEDTKGRLADLVNPFSQTFHQEYDLDGKPTLTQFPSGLQEVRTYTPRDWLSMMQVQDARGTPLKTLEDFYTDAQGTYDPTGHLQREVENGTATHSFFYNPHYELTGETLPNATSILYGLDANGNRTSVTTNGVVDNYHVDGANKLLWVNRNPDPNVAPTPGQSDPYTILGYDADGRVNSRDRLDVYGLRRILNLTWDSDDRLQQVTSGTDSLLAATYNGAGERVSKTDFWTGTHNYSWGPGGILADSNASTTYTPGFSQRQNGTDRFFHTDWLGSTRYLSDSGGSFPDTLGFDAFGNRTSASTEPYPTEFQFGASSGYQTEYASATDPGVGLQLLGERYYDPVVGRFISPDPIGFAGGLNLYQYCGNDPVNCTDPSGTQELGYQGIIPVGQVPSARELEEDAVIHSQQHPHAAGLLAPDTEVPAPLAGTGEPSTAMAEAASAVEAAEFTALESRLLGVATPVSRPCDPLEPAVDPGSAGEIGPGSGLTIGTRKGVVFFEGREIRAVRSLAHLSAGTLRAMVADPFSGRDERGQTLILHHFNQDPNGVLIEIPADRHSIWNPIQHPYGNTPGVGLSDAERADFDGFRERYWKARGEAELLRRGLTW